MSTSSSSTVEDMRQSIALQDINSSEALAMNPIVIKSSLHGRHASWADHKSTSDGDILTLDSPRPGAARSTTMDGHVRSLSGQMFGMNLSPDNSVTYSPDQEPPDFSDFEHRDASQVSPKDTSSSSFLDHKSIYPTQEASENVGKKHRRGISEGNTNPLVAHRRMDSGGNVAFIDRHGEYPTQQIPYSTQPDPSYRHNRSSPPMQQPIERKPSPSYDQGHYRYGPVAASSYRSSQPSLYRSNSQNSKTSHHHNHPSPRQDNYHHLREEEMHRRSYPQRVPPRYQSYRGGGYPPHGVVDPGMSHPRYPSPHGSPFPEEVGSRHSTGNRYPQSHQFQRDENSYYLPPRGGPYPIQYANDGGERRYAPLPQHPLVDHGAYPTYSLPPYRRQTSHNSLGTGSDGRIETDENLFAGESRAILSSSPRKSPQLFDLALHGKPIPSHISSSPPEFIHYSGGLSEEPRSYQSSSHFPPLPPGENRIRTASSDSNIKQFISAVETSQAHKRGESTDSFIFNDSLFGENILEPNPLESNITDDVDPVDSLAPIPVSNRDQMSSTPPVASIQVPPPIAADYGYHQYNAYPDTTRSHSISPAYGTNDDVSKLPSLSNLESALKACSTSSQSSTIESTESKPRGRQITGKVSKRARRKCSVEHCQNRVVQGGLCISHGAKRKLCGHPGCTKHVKKAGMCSTHGPPRKLCEFEGCTKVAVQGGRCISHGAKKKMCAVEGCKKQAILSGMCKKHHDEDKGPMYCQPVYDETNHASHDYGDHEEEDLQTPHKPKHTRGLSIFTDRDIQEKIIKKEINL